MRIFTTLNHIINIETISSVDTQRGVVYLIGGNTVSLSNDELRNIKSVLNELHRQTCAKESSHA